MSGVVQGLLGCADSLILLIFTDLLVTPSLGDDVVLWVQSGYEFWQVLWVFGDNSRQAREFCLTGNGGPLL